MILINQKNIELIKINDYILFERAIVNYSRARISGVLNKIEKYESHIFKIIRINEESSFYLRNKYDGLITRYYFHSIYNDLSKDIISDTNKCGNPQDKWINENSEKFYYGLTFINSGLYFALNNDEARLIQKKLIFGQ